MSKNILSFDEFDEVLSSAESRFHNRIGELNDFVARESIYLFGYGAKGRILARHIAKAREIQVIVYDSNAQSRRLAAQEGFSTIDSLDGLRRGEFGVILGACQAQIEQFDTVHRNHIYYQEAAYLFDAPYLENKVRDFPAWIIRNKEHLYKTYTSAHPQSRDSLLNILRFRLSLDPHDLASTRKQNSEMWFDIPRNLARRNYGTFLDVGAYDGDTLLQAQRRLSTSRGIAVEANTSLFDSIRRVGESYERGVQIIPRAAWSHTCRLHFAEVWDGMIAVSEAADGELEAGPIDDGVNEQVDLIKMDIEGAEVPALNGCLRTLTGGPDLAIAGYHRPDDLVRLPVLLEKAGYVSPVFDLHIAHYSDCLDDTILYFLKT